MSLDTGVPQHLHQELRVSVVVVGPPHPASVSPGEEHRGCATRPRQHGQAGVSESLGV